MNKPAAVIDKSLLQAICEQDAEEKRSAYYKILSKHYQVVVTLVLVEEIWVNIAKPNEKTPPAVLANMREFLRLHGSWIANLIQTNSLSMSEFSTQRKKRLLQQVVRYPGCSKRRRKRQEPQPWNWP